MHVFIIEPIGYVTSFQRFTQTLTPTITTTFSNDLCLIQTAAQV